ncbi:MAG: hypothetical protein MZV64_31775 [Ignavibacteriales bacterium]|nr:hypothetical protein [Ignavibacteriales bacterium]
MPGHSRLLPVPAHVHPRAARDDAQLARGDPDVGVRGPGRGVDPRISLEADIEVDVQAVLQPEGAHPAHRVAGRLQDLFRAHHPRLCLEGLSELLVIDPCISRGDHDDAAADHREGESLGDERRIDPQGPGRQFHGPGALAEFPYLEGKPLARQKRHVPVRRSW